MASPLGWFRRNQKGMLVVFGVLLMASFGLGSVMYTLTPRAAPDESADRPVVEYRDGTLTRGDMQMLRRAHFLAVNFLKQIRSSMADRRGAEYRPRAVLFEEIVVEVPPEQLDAQVLDRQLVLNKAHEMGVQISNEAVMSYIRHLADDTSLTARDMDRFARQFFNNEVDFIRIRDQIKKELAIQEVRRMFGAGLPITGNGYSLPSLTEAWEYFLRLERRIECEVLPFAVADYMDKVAESPSDAELRKTFDDGKYREPDLAGEKAGFKRPRKISATLLRAIYNEFHDRAKLAVTPEQIQAEYDRLVNENSPIVTEIVPSQPNPADDNMTGEDPPPPLDDLPNDGNSSNDDGALDESLDSSVDTSDDGDDSGDDSGDGSEKSDEGGDDGGDGGSVSLIKSPGQRLVSTASLRTAGENLTRAFQEENPAEKGEENLEKSAEESRETPPGESPDNEDSADTTQDELPPAVEPPDDATPQQDDPLDLGPVPIVQTRIKPLDEKLSDEIRGRLAHEPAATALHLAVNDAAAEIMDYGDELATWTQSRDLPMEEREPEPEPIDLKAIAARYRLHVEHVDLSSEIEMMQTDVGKTLAVIEVPTYGQVQRRPVPVYELLFARFDEMDPWRSEVHEVFLSKDQFVLFAEDKRDPVIPEFSDAREEVVEYWKREKALKLATEAAAEAAKSINESGAKLAEEFPDQARNTGGFSWHSQTSMYPNLQGDVRPGEDFMKAAFALETGEASVAPDILRENVYVIQQVSGETRTNEQLEEEFFESLSANKGISPGIRQFHSIRIREAIREFSRQLNEEMGVRWIAH